MKPIQATQARANQWANGLLYAELAKLAPEQLTQSFGVNFGSILGIASHTVLADRAWLQRLSGEGSPLTRDSLQPFTDFAVLRAARQAEDARIVAFAEALDPQRLSETLHYTSLDGKPCVEPFAVCLAQFQGHQVFHRGQLHALLGVFGITAPDMDLIYYHVSHRGDTA